MEKATYVISKAGNATDDIAIEVTLTRRNFNNIDCRDRRMLVVIEGRRPHFWLSVVLEQMEKACPWKNATATAIAKAKVVAETGKTPNGVGK